ncbi:MAG: hypothetical protein JWR38_481 [Mucilaginibacter sp.]|nr:hypothetical protein [Mucilaginibacter sp.]
MTSLKRDLPQYKCKFTLILTLILLSCFSINPAIANSVKQKAEIAFDTPLKAFEGTYQLKENESIAYQITATDDKLVAKLVNGDRQLTLTRKSEFAFEFKDSDGDEILTAVFSKNDAGEISQILVEGKQLWVKVKNDVPAKEVKLSPEQLKAFAGKYQFEEKNDAFLQITATADGLLLKQLWDGREINFIAVSDVDFLNKEIPFPLKFTKDTNGVVIKVLAFNRDLWDKVKE